MHRQPQARGLVKKDGGLVWGELQVGEAQFGQLAAQAWLLPGGIGTEGERAKRKINHLANANIAQVADVREKWCALYYIR